MWAPASLKHDDQPTRVGFLMTPDYTIVTLTSG